MICQTEVGCWFDRSKLRCAPLVLAAARSREALQCGLAIRQLFQSSCAGFPGAHYHSAHYVLDEYPADLRVKCRGGDATERTQQPKPGPSVFEYIRRSSGAAFRSYSGPTNPLCLMISLWILYLFLIENLV